MTIDEIRGSYVTMLADLTEQEVNVEIKRFQLEIIALTSYARVERYKREGAAGVESK